MNIPRSLRLANLPTKIEKLERLSENLGVNIYIKRDDQTGTEVSGNKVRKLEFSVQEALDQGCDYLITCGGIQSNHARATAAVAAKLGIGAYLVLRGSGCENIEGNYFLDQMLGADIKFITPEEYRDSRMKIMIKIQVELAKKGKKGYIIPEGASNGIGLFGYYKAMEEIFNQEKELGIKFDAIVTTVGSGGTYAGLLYANRVYKNTGKIYGINICDTAEHFEGVVKKLILGSAIYTGQEVPCDDDIIIIDGYVGDGYAQSRSEEIDFIKYLGRLEGIILDPVYTGKAMYGLAQEIKKGTFSSHNNILFIHTGGLYGWSAKARNLLK